MKQFDRTRLDAKVANVSSYFISIYLFFENDLAPVVVIIAIVVIMTIIGR